MTTDNAVSGDTGGRQGIPDDLRSDAPLDLPGLLGAVQFALDRAKDAVDRMAEALERERCRGVDSTDYGSPPVNSLTKRHRK